MVQVSIPPCRYLGPCVFRLADGKLVSDISLRHIPCLEHQAPDTNKICFSLIFRRNHTCQSSKGCLKTTLHRFQAFRRSAVSRTGASRWMPSHRQSGQSQVQPKAFLPAIALTMLILALQSPRHLIQRQPSSQEMKRRRHE